MKTTLLILGLLFPLLLSSQTWNVYQNGHPDKVVNFISDTEDGCTWFALGRYINMSAKNLFQVMDANGDLTSGTFANCGFDCLNITSIYAKSCNEAYVTLYRDSLGGVLLHTVDQGVTWDTVPDVDFNFGEEWGFANWVVFFNENDGLCMGDAWHSGFRIYRTSDGGDSWTLVDSANIPEVQQFELGYENGYEVVGKSIWFLTYANRLFYSDNAGENWEVYDLPININNLPQIAFKDHNNGIISQIGGISDYIITEDGGKTWQRDTLPFDFALMEYAKGVDGDPGNYIVTGDSGVVFSSNFGETWQHMPGNITSRTHNVKFVSTERGWVTDHDGNLYEYQGDVLNVDEFQEYSGLKLYPNPASDQLVVEFNEKRSGTCQVLSASGQSVARFNYEGVRAALDVSAFSKGMYFLKFQSHDGKIDIEKFSVK